MNAKAETPIAMVSSPPPIHQLLSVGVFGNAHGQWPNVRIRTGAFGGAAGRADGWEALGKGLFSLGPAKGANITQWKRAAFCGWKEGHLGARILVCSSCQTTEGI